MRDLFEYFDILAQAPGGVKKLREMILQFAVQGEIVPQDPNDEPASVLLEKIKEEKERLEKEGKIKKQKDLEPIRENEIPFDLPDGWEWSKFGNATNYASTEKIEAKCFKPKTWILELEDIEKVTSRVIQKLSFAERQSKSTKNVFNSGDVIYGKLRPYLDKVIVADEAGVCTTEMIPINGYGFITPFYLRWFLKSPYFLEYANSSTHGMRMPRLGTDKALNAFFAFPPLPEQKRIVAKVDSLMALCDDLEKQQQGKAEKKRTLNKASLHALNNSSTKQEFNKTWNHITKNFDLLYSTHENVKDLKQTILQLAVQGKLVPQNPNDEPASVLLERIKVEKERLIKEGKIKKQKALDPIRDSEIPFDLPAGWEWCRLNALGETQTGTTPSKKHPANFGKYIPFIGPGDMADSLIYYENNGLSKIGLKKGRLIKANSIMMVCIGGSIGKCAINTIDVTCNQQINTITPFISDCYLATYYTLISQYFKTKVLEFSGGSATPIINKQKWSSIIVPLPPLAEQKRIAAKVDSLMALCDRLSKNLTDKETRSEKLLNAVVNQLQ